MTPKPKLFLNDEDLGKWVYADVKWAQDYRRPREEEWLRFYRLYKNFLDRKQYPFDANLAIPTGHTIVEVQVSILLDMIFESGDFLEVLGKTESGQVSAHAVKEMLNYHFRHSFNTYEDMQRYIRQLLCYGTSVYKVFWDYREDWQSRHIPKYVNKEFTEYEAVTAPAVVSNKPNGYVVDLWNFGIDPNSDSIGGARYAFEEMWLDPSFLISMEQLGIYKNTVDVITPAGEDYDVNEGLKDRYEEINFESYQQSPYCQRGKVHCVDYWGYITSGWKEGRLSKRSKTQLVHVVMAVGNAGLERPIILLAEPSPYQHGKIPFVASALNQCVGEFYGTGDLELCESLIVEQRDIRNVMMDNMSRTANKMFKVRKDAKIDDGELVWRPAGKVHVEEMDDVQILESGGVDVGIFKVLEDIRRDTQESSGVNDFTIGQYRSSTGFNDTATGITLIQEVALKRTAHKGQIVQRAVRDIGQQTFALVAQYQPYGSTIRVLDRNAAMQYRFMDIGPESLKRQYDFHVVNAASLGSKPMRQNQLVNLLQILLPLAERGESPLDLRAYVRRLLEETGIPNPNELLGHPGLNQPIPQLPLPEGQHEMVDPNEENRMMIDMKKMMYPKSGEPHPNHIFTHQEAHEMIDDPEAQNLLAQHVELHMQLMETEKQLMASQMAAKGDAMATGQALQLIQGGQGTKSPNRAGGQEDATRQAANVLAGNI